MSTSSIVGGSCRTGSGTVSRTATPVIFQTTSAQALQVLDIDRGPDVDAGGEQLRHVLPALGMAAVGSVGVREFVDDDQLGLALERRVEVELLDRAAAIFDHAPRQDFEPLDERARLRAAMSLDEADDDIDAFVLRRRAFCNIA